MNENCAALINTGRHDWRVDPGQLIKTLDGTSFVQVECASCGQRSTKEGRFRWEGRPGEPRTWRPYVDGIGF